MSEHTLHFKEHEFEVTFEPTGTPIVKFVGGLAVVGYLSPDYDCEDPTKNCDGMGKIVHKNGSDEKYRFREALGLDEYDNTEDEDGKPLPYNHMAVPLYYVDQSHGVYQFRDEKDRANAVWIPDDSCIEHIKSTAIEALLPEGSKVEYKTLKLNPDGTVICKKDGKPDPRFFNVITWTLPDGRSKGGYKNFVEASKAMAKAAGLKLTKEAIRRGEELAAVKCAKSCVGEVNKWLAGDCYGIVKEVYRQTADGCWERDYDYDDEACWGFIGEEYAIEEIKGIVEREAKDLEKLLTPLATPAAYADDALAVLAEE